MGLNRFDLHVSYDNGTTWDLLADNVGPSTREYLWNLPNINCSQCKVKVTAYDDAGFSTTSISGTFTIAIKETIIPGKSFVKEYQGNVPLNDIQIFEGTDGNYGWAVGNDGLVLNKCGGAWTQVAIAGLEAYNLNAVYFLKTNTQYGWIVGEKKEEPGKYRGILMRTTTNGSSWSEIIDMPSLPPNTAFRDVYFAGNGTGYIACANGIVLKSTNYGETWPLDQIKRPVSDPNGVSIWYQDVYTDPGNANKVRVVGDAFGVNRRTERSKG